jgi:hypothetical protein
MHNRLDIGFENPIRCALTNTLTAWHGCCWSDAVFDTPCIVHHGHGILSPLYAIVCLFAPDQQKA